MADLGVIEICRGPASDFSPLTDLRKAYVPKIRFQLTVTGWIGDKRIPS